MKKLAVLKLVSLLIPSLTLLTGVNASADEHEHHHHQHQELKAGESNLSGASFFQIASKWTDQTGKEMTLANLKGRPRLLGMIYTSCKAACPTLAQDMKSIAEKLPSGERARLGLTLLSFDPARDRKEALLDFKTKQKLNSDAWILLSPKTEADATEAAAALGVQFKKLDNGDYIHSNVIFLLNSDGEIIARKEGLGTKSDSFTSQLRAAVAKK